ncbi:MAG: hypothetical protein ABID64_04340 [Nitrospirota bacterium]
MGDKKEVGKLERNKQPLKLQITSQKAVIKKAAAQRLVLRKATSGSSRDVVRESLEKRGDIHKEYYKMSESETDNENVKKMRKLKPTVLVGSVDSTRFTQKWHEAKWYKPYINAASQISKLESKLDPATKKWFKDLKPALDVFLKLGTYTGSDRVLKRKYQKDIWALVKKSGSDIVYGKKGVLNFLLAFRRITNVNSNLDDLSVEQIKLTLGDGVGKKKGAKSRFAYMIVKEEQKAQLKVKPKVKPKVQPKVKPKVEQFGSEEFCKKYEIAKPDVFKKDLDQFKEWITDDKMKYLQDKDFWKEKPGETPGQADARFMGLFSSKRAGIRKLYTGLTGLDLYEKWFAEANDDTSRKYKLLYFWVVKRMAEYTQKYVADPRILKDSLLHYHKKVILTEGLLKGKSDKVVLMQLVDSSEYLMENDDDAKERERWKKLNSKYKKEFSK